MDGSISCTADAVETLKKEWLSWVCKVHKEKRAEMLVGFVAKRLKVAKTGRWLNLILD